VLMLDGKRLVELPFRAAARAELPASRELEVLRVDASGVE
jgi:hypothetical protein